MSKTRFLRLTKYFHLCDTSNVLACEGPQYNPLYKIQNFINLILALFKSNFNLGHDLSVDEAMIGMTFFSVTFCDIWVPQILYRMAGWDTHWYDTVFIL